MQTPIVVVTHGEWGRTLVNIAQEIAGKQPGLSAESLAFDESPDTLEERLTDLAAKHGGVESVLFLVDLRSGTPWNVILRLMKKGRVNCVSGVNLPMLLEAILRRTNATAPDLAAIAAEAGRLGISESATILREMRKE